VQYKSEVAIGTALTVIGIVVMLAALGAVSGLLRLAGLLGRRLRARDEAAVESLIQETTTRGIS
jgi:hypothetical protein